VYLPTGTAEEPIKISSTPNIYHEMNGRGRPEKDMITAKTLDILATYDLPWKQTDCDADHSWLLNTKQQ
jgi:hypothetical protein